MLATRIAITALALVCATAAAAQTHAELLEKAIFTDETAGDLPGAIRLYERLLNTPGLSREMAARAQTRLADGKRRRDLAVVSLAMQPHTQSALFAQRVNGQRVEFQDPSQQAQGIAGMFSGLYDPARPVTVRGKVVQAVWVNPLTYVVIEGSDGNRWGFTTAPPNSLVRAGFNRETFKLGEELVIGGFMAKGETQNCPAPLPNACATLENGALHGSASIITASDGKVLFDRPAFNSAAATAPAK